MPVEREVRGHVARIRAPEAAGARAAEVGGVSAGPIGHRIALDTDQALLAVRNPAHHLAQVPGGRSRPHLADLPYADRPRILSGRPPRHPPEAEVRDQRGDVGSQEDGARRADRHPERRRERHAEGQHLRGDLLHPGGLLLAPRRQQRIRPPFGARVLGDQGGDPRQRGLLRRRIAAQLRLLDRHALLDDLVDARRLRELCADPVCAGGESSGPLVELHHGTRRIGAPVPEAIEHPGGAPPEFAGEVHQLPGLTAESVGRRPQRARVDGDGAAAGDLQLAALAHRSAAVPGCAERISSATTISSTRPRSCSHAAASLSENPPMSFCSPSTLRS